MEGIVTHSTIQHSVHIRESSNTWTPAVIIDINSPHFRGKSHGIRHNGFCSLHWLTGHVTTQKQILSSVQMAWIVKACIIILTNVSYKIQENFLPSSYQLGQCADGFKSTMEEPSFIMATVTLKRNSSKFMWLLLLRIQQTLLVSATLR